MESLSGLELTSTMRKFGAPVSIVRRYDHWLVLLREKQVTLGSLVLISTEDAKAWPMLSAAAFEELKLATSHIEQVLKQTFDYDKINYLMLMMVDPDVHFHVVPRYESPRDFAGNEFLDPGWPGPPRLDSINDTDDAMNTLLKHELIRCWPE